MSARHGDIAIRRVLTARDIDAFNTAADLAQASNPRFVTGVRNEMHWFLGPSSPLLRDNTIEAFVAYRDGRPVGRIAAIVDGAHALKYGSGTGHFGFLDAIDDPDVFDALFDAAETSLRTHGMTRMEGPFSLSINQETGVLVDGFDEPHVMRTNHAPPFYRLHLERAGFRKAMDLVAARCVIAQSDYPERVAAVMAKSPLARDVTTYGLGYRTWTAQFPRIITLYNDAWADNWASVPVGPGEGQLISRLMLPVCKPSWIRIATYRGEPIAIVSQVPDVNEALEGLDGRLLPFGFAKLLWRIHGRGLKRSRIPMIGVARRWRGTRVGSLAITRLMAEAIIQARNAKIVETDISWMLEHNAAVLNLVTGLPARITRRFRVYERTIPVHDPS